MKQPSKQEMVWRLAKFGLAVVVVALLAGVGGMGLALLLRLIQRLAFEGPAGAIPATVSFLDRVIATSPERRVAVLGLCGVIAAAGWCAVHRFGKPLVSIPQALRADDPRMPIIPTIGHALLQIFTVALGSPLGREVAPREIGALVAGWIAQVGKFSRDDTTVLVACGAMPAGLAALTLVGKLVFVIAVLWAGAQGLLTPGLTLGALGGILLGAAWSVFWPGVPVPSR